MNALTLSTLRPGILVSLKTTIRGNVSYRTQDIERDHITEYGERQARWETLRTVSNPEEHETAIKARSRARALVTSVCSQSAFGLLCPESRKDDLANAISEARSICADFNRTATHSRVTVYVIAGRIADSDLEATRAIGSEVRDLLADMESGIARLDVKAVREAANKARNLGQMLNPDAAARLQDAITAVRTVARRIVNSGETASTEIDAYTLARLASARTAFLDMDAPEEAQIAPVSFSEPARAIDFEPADEVTADETTAWRARTPELEFDDEPEAFDQNVNRGW